MGKKSALVQVICSLRKRGVNPVEFPVKHIETGVYVLEDDHPYATSQLRTTPADERHPHQLPVTLAEALLDPDDADILGACAGSEGKLSDCVITDRWNFEVNPRFIHTSPIIAESTLP